MFTEKCIWLPVFRGSSGRNFGARLHRDPALKNLCSIPAGCAFIGFYAFHAFPEKLISSHGFRGFGEKKIDPGFHRDPAPKETPAGSQMVAIPSIGIAYMIFMHFVDWLAGWLLVSGQMRPRVE